jgi:hypothetical protein
MIVDLTSQITLLGSIASCNVPILLNPFSKTLIVIRFIDSTMSESQQYEFASSQFGGDYDNLSYLAPSNYPATPSTSQTVF